MRHGRAEKRWRFAPSLRRKRSGFRPAGARARAQRATRARREFAVGRWTSWQKRIAFELRPQWASMVCLAILTAEVACRPSVDLQVVRPTDRNRLAGDRRLSELLAPNRPVRYAFQRQQSGVDFAYLSTRYRPNAGAREPQLPSVKLTPAYASCRQSRQSRGKLIRVGCRPSWSRCQSGRI
jgi:hypothetical protein